MPVIQFPYMEIVWKALFSKKKFLISFFLSPVCSSVLKKPQKWFYFFNCFSKKYENCMTSIFPYIWCMDWYDNDFCWMELYDKHFRCMEVNPGYCPKFIGFQYFFLKRCSIPNKGQPEHSELCPDIRAVLFIF